MRPMDILRDARCDLLNVGMIRILDAIIGGSWIDILHIAPPCTTFTTAVTPPRRTPESPHGRPGLSQAVVAELWRGVRLIMIAAHFFVLQDSTGGAAGLEHPLKTLALLIPDFVKALQPFEWGVFDF